MSRKINKSFIDVKKKKRNSEKFLQISVLPAGYLRVTVINIYRPLLLIRIVHKIQFKKTALNETTKYSLYFFLPK